ncbi:hypothetical protein SAMN05216252_14918 [Actinacidiphila glaucinigra]|uniref:Uncharacterized protein n=1 Tax=Actinacidiphila glaucinigra TaxID=235986 RepID=A0A239NWF6_9ACTN|nr:hypothetical protein SAMN05216252_14918 [Actinacidiphila glaucinigra]
MVLMEIVEYISTGITCVGALAPVVGRLCTAGVLDRLRRGTPTDASAPSARAAASSAHCERPPTVNVVCYRSSHGDVVVVCCIPAPRDHEPERVR